jgi:hypothetical protein
MPIDDGTYGPANGSSAGYGLNGEPLCTNGCWTGYDADAWATRGAINAGFAVFLYLDGVAKGSIHQIPSYDQCGQLQ